MHRLLYNISTNWCVHKRKNCPLTNPSGYCAGMLAMLRTRLAVPKKKYNKKEYETIDKYKQTCLIRLFGCRLAL